MRKRVKKEKPKVCPTLSLTSSNKTKAMSANSQLEHELLQTIPVWENQRNRPFLVNGIRVVDVLMESVEADAGKENRKVRVNPTARSQS